MQHIKQIRITCKSGFCIPFIFSFLWFVSLRRNISMSLTAHVPLNGTGFCWIWWFILAQLMKTWCPLSFIELSSGYNLAFNFMENNPGTLWVQFCKTCAYQNWEAISRKQIWSEAPISKTQNFKRHKLMFTVGSTSGPPPKTFAFFQHVNSIRVEGCLSRDHRVNPLRRDSAVRIVFSCLGQVKCFFGPVNKVVKSWWWKIIKAAALHFFPLPRQCWDLHLHCTKWALKMVSGMSPGKHDPAVRS